MRSDKRPVKKEPKANPAIKEVSTVVIAKLEVPKTSPNIRIQTTSKMSPLTPDNKKHPKISIFIGAFSGEWELEKTRRKEIKEEKF